MITDLRLQHFRSYRDASFEFDKSVNIIVGPNASGKTNLLEAVLFWARGSSYRAKDQELISFNKPWARLEGHTVSGNERVIKLVADPPSKVYELDSKPYKRLSAQNNLPAVLFEPNHLLLLSGGPDRRREYLDDLLEQLLPGYGTTRRHYKRALAQRNRLLKQGGNIANQVFPWNMRLSELAGQIVRERATLTNKLNQNITTLYKDLSGSKTTVTIAYNHHWQSDHYETRLLKELESRLPDDVIKGFTSVGPHREDLVVRFDGHPVQETASRGETRTTILALKILELEILSEVRDTTPLLLLDDVFSELDGKRRHALTDYLAAYQTFITTTDADLIVKNFTQKANVIATLITER